MEQADPGQIAIRRLPPDVVARIAAGEMISRPSAMVKELIENALDAEAERISVEIVEALDRLVRIADDGSGIPSGELPLALERFATSKISGEEDLLSVGTLGFRGEALASIAEISRLTLLSRSRTEPHAWQIRGEAGRIGPVQAAARAPGTTITVEDLFFNTPVRKRFLKQGPAETRQARTTLIAYALSRPGVGWTLDLDGRRTLDLAPAADLRGRLLQIHGERLGQGLIPIDGGSDGLRLHGFLGVPELARAGTQHQTLFVNGRWVSAPWISQAVRTGFGDLLPSHHHPWFVLFLVLPPDQVDVNLHPTKREVRFLDERAVFGQVQRAVHQVAARLVPRIFLEAEGPGSADGRPGGAATPSDVAGGARHPAGAFPSTGSRPTSSFAPGGSRPAGPEAPGLFPARPGWESRAPGVDGLVEAARLYGAAPGPETDTEAGGDTLAGELVSLWQLHNRYVLAQTRKGLLIIDQHAAHERILYEQIRERLMSGEAGAQQTFFPAVVVLDDAQMMLFHDVQESLTRMGFAFEPLDDRSIHVRGVPPLWRAHGEATLLRELLDEAANVGLREGETVETLARSYACRAAIKGTEKLSIEEMNQLVNALFATSRPHGDPHGRPTFVFLSLADIDRRFSRGPAQ